jgi:hypothetical protein
MRGRGSRRPAKTQNPRESSWLSRTDSRTRAERRGFGASSAAPTSTGLEPRADLPERCRSSCGEVTHVPRLKSRLSSNRCRGARGAKVPLLRDFLGSPVQKGDSFRTPLTSGLPVAFRPKAVRPTLHCLAAGHCRTRESPSHWRHLCRLLGASIPQPVRVQGSALSLCRSVSHRQRKSVPLNVPDPDPHHFDGDHDGIGCET